MTPKKTKSKASGPRPSSKQAEDALRRTVKRVAAQKPGLTQTELPSKKRFCKTFATFEEWRANTKGKPKYIQRITKRVEDNPDITLDEARGHGPPKVKEPKEPPAIPVSRLPVDNRTPEQSLRLEKSRGVYNEMRRNGLSLNEAARKRDVEAEQVLASLDAFKIVEGEWVPKAYYMSPTAVHVITEGKDHFLIIADSRHRELIARHHNAIKMALAKGERFLKDFQGRKVKDTSGKWWELETDLQTLYAINEAREDPEFYDIYKQ